MIPAPNAYYETEEDRLYGARPWYQFSFFPHYFLTGLESGAGAFVDCTYVSPGRAQVSVVDSASWTGPVKAANLDDYPAYFIPSWTVIPQDYIIAVEYRTATTSAGVSEASWTALVDGLTYPLYQYYQARVVFILEVLDYRNLTSDFGDTPSAQDAWAVDDAGDEYLSYTADGIEPGAIAYVEALILLGEFPIPLDDVIDAGEISLEDPLDFSDLVAGEFNITLENVTGKYDLNSTAFIFSGEEFWWAKRLRVKLGFKRPGTEIVDYITRYEGILIDPGPARQEIGDDASPDFPTIEFYTQDYVSWLLQQMMGTPDSHGQPQPLIYGEVLLSANQLMDQSPTTPEKTAGFETGDLSEVSSTAVSSGGTLAPSTLHPYRGNYAVKAAVDGLAANQYAFVNMENPSTGTQILASGVMYIQTRPEIPDAQSARIMGLYGLVPNDAIDLYVDNDTRLWVHYHIYDGGWYQIWDETDCFLSAYTQMHVRVSMALLGTNPGIVKVWVAGDEVYSSSRTNWSAFPALGAWFGVHTGVTPEAWEIHWDELAVYDTFNPCAYQVDGGPFEEILAVYVDGSILTEQIPRRSRRQRSLDRRLKRKIKSGRKLPTANYTAFEDLGMIVFLDWENPPSGEIMVKVRKNTLTHPVDIISAILGLAGLTAQINTASFAAAKAAIPDDNIGCCFEDMGAGECLKEIVSRSLISLYVDQGQIFLRAYTGAPPAVADFTLTDDNIKSIEGGLDTSEIRPKVTVDWGWSDRNPDLHYEASDPELVEVLGKDSEELSFAWGEPVASEDSAMARRKADNLFLRMKAPREKYDVTGFMELARIQLGDVVSRDGLLYRVNIVNCTMDWPPEIGLGLVRFLGEV